jgi:hypothetical protein
MPIANELAQCTNRYKLVLPSEDELRAELDRERNKLAIQIDREESQ